MRLTTLLLAPLLLLSATAIAGEAPPSDAPTSTEHTTAPERRYSPFAIRLEGGEGFTVISFQDVGMRLDGEVDPASLYEVISQSVAAAIETDEGLTYEATPIYDPRLTQPGEHLFCDPQHLYVALWRGLSPPRWGYSLWSGCGEADQFSWLEVPAPFDASLSLPDLVEPLARSIVDSLGTAEERDCFQLNC